MKRQLANRLNSGDQKRKILKCWVAHGSYSQILTNIPLVFNYHMHRLKYKQVIKSEVWFFGFQKFQIDLKNADYIFYCLKWICKSEIIKRNSLDWATHQILKINKGKVEGHYVMLLLFFILLVKQSNKSPVYTNRTICQCLLLVVNCDGR